VRNNIQSLNPSARNQFDFRDMFLADRGGNVSEADLKLYPSSESFHEAQIEQTKEDFASIDYNNMTADAIDKVQAVAETVLSKVKRSVKLYDPIGLMFTKAKGQLGKKIEAHEINGGKVYSYTYGGIRRVSALKHKTYTISTDSKSVHFAVPIEQLKSGRFTTADMVYNATQAILRSKIALAYNTLDTAYTNGGTFTTDAGGVALSQPKVNEAIDAVSDYDAGGMVLVGRSKTVAPISDFVGSSTLGGLSDVALEEVRKQGYLTTYRGADIVRLRYVKDGVYGTEPFGLDNVFVMSNEKAFNRYVEVAPITRRAWVNPEDGMFHIIFEFEDGAAVWALEYGRKIYNIG